jgi:hypothetical protein
MLDGHHVSTNLAPHQFLHPKPKFRHRDRPLRRRITPNPITIDHN